MFCTTKMKSTWHQQKHYIAYCKKFFLFVWYATELSLKDKTDETIGNIEQGLILLKKYYLRLNDVINSIRSLQSKHSLCKIEWYNPYPNFHPCTYQTLLRLPVWHKKVRFKGKYQDPIRLISTTIMSWAQLFTYYTVRVLDLLTLRTFLRSCDAELASNKIVEHVKKVRYNKHQCIN
jgi:hypothetical protein